MLNVFKRISGKDWLGFFAVTLVVICLDQITKYLVLDKLTHGQVLEVIPGLFNIVLAYNLGAAFGMLADLQDGTRQIVLLCTTALALSVVFYFLLFEYHQSKWGRFALGMIFGGAAGNIIDRLQHGMVVDFLDFYYKENHWPAFNIADSAICVAVFLLLFQRPKKEKS